MTTRGAGQAGFTLLEVMVAFIIAAIALAVLFRGAADSLQAVTVATRTEEAVARAKSHMAASGITPVPGEQTGDDGSGFSYRVVTRPIDSFRLPTDSAVEGETGASVTLYGITVWITWKDAGRTHEMRLDSERLGTTGGS